MIYYCKKRGCLEIVTKTRKYCSDEHRRDARLKTVKQWKNAIWPMFASYIRLRDSKGQEYVKCFTCPSIIPTKGSEAGHWLHGDWPGTWLDERNVHIQCTACNHHKSGNGAEYSIQLERVYGFGILQELRNLKGNSIQAWTVPMLRQIYYLWASKVKK